MKTTTQPDGDTPPPQPPGPDELALLPRLLAAVAGVAAGLELGEVLRHLVEAATDLAGARYGALAVLDDAGRVAEFVTIGMDAAEVARIGTPPVGRGVLGALIDDPRPVRLFDLAEHPAAAGFPPGHPPMRSFLGVPIRIGDDVFGNLYLCEKVGEPEFSAADELLVGSLAAIAAVAVENARLHTRQQDLAILRDRERIARDLHDTVIQRLFATGMSLQVASRRPAAGLAARVEHAVDELDGIVEEIRRTIFDLAVDPADTPGLGAAVRAVVDAMTRDTTLDVSVRLAADLDAAVDPTVVDATVAATREILANTVRHADASVVSVTLDLDGDHVVLVVEDDGRGLGDTGPEHRPGHGNGVANLAARAADLGGTFRITARVPRGVRTEWTAQVRHGRRTPVGGHRDAP